MDFDAWWKNVILPYKSYQIKMKYKKVWDVAVIAERKRIEEIIIAQLGSSIAAKKLLESINNDST